METLSILQEKLGAFRLEENKDIGMFFTLRIPVQAEYYFEPTSQEDWTRAIQTVYLHNIPLFILGGGSNYAVMQPIVRGLVLRNQYKGISIISQTEQQAQIHVASGTIMSQLVRFANDYGFAGLEYHMGLPGTVGGAIVMNSKWTQPQAYVGDVIESVELLNREGQMRVMPRDYMEFSYGYSKVQDTEEIVLGATFLLQKEDPEVLKKRSMDVLDYRRSTQPHGVATSGCFFKNIEEEDKQRLGIPTKSAGYLIDHAGLKGLRKGAFVVSETHANFIINEGQGTLEDLQNLIQTIKETVHERYNIELREEVIVL